MSHNLGQLSQIRRIMVHLDTSLGITADSAAFNLVNSQHVTELRQDLARAYTTAENIARELGERHFSVPSKQEVLHENAVVVAEDGRKEDKNDNSDSHN
jgi:hypothetical protein